MRTDAELIADLGGPTKVAEMLNFPKHGGAQRVQNWLTRGIPAQVKIDHPEIFLLDRTSSGGSEQEKAAA